MIDGRTVPRVLHVGPLPPSMGGVAAALQMILRCPALAGFEQRTFNVFRGGRPELVGRKVPTPARVARRVALTMELARVVGRERPDIIHFHLGSESTLDVIGALLMMRVGGRCGGSIILHMHADPATADIPGTGRSGQALFCWLIRPTRAIFVLTARYRDHLLACGATQPTPVVPNMCDERLAALPMDRPRPRSGVRAIMLGRLPRQKGVFDLLEAVCI